MTNLTEIRVPYIGDFTDVPVIEILVEVGDRIRPEDPLVTLESDKATMDVPAPAAGVVRELAVTIGDSVSEGSVLLRIAAEGDDAGAEKHGLWSAGCRITPSANPTYCKDGSRDLGRSQGMNDTWCFASRLASGHLRRPFESSQVGWRG